jgi:hypothetical protein
VTGCEQPDNSHGACHRQADQEKWPHGSNQGVRDDVESSFADTDICLEVTGAFPHVQRLVRQVVEEPSRGK